MERVAGIEPALSGRKHDILPLNYTRIFVSANKVVIYNFLTLLTIDTNINQFIKV